MAQQKSGQCTCARLSWVIWGLFYALLSPSYKQLFPCEIWWHFLHICDATLGTYFESGFAERSPRVSLSSPTLQHFPAWAATKAEDANASLRQNFWERKATRAAYFFIRLQKIVVSVLLRPCQQWGAEVLVNSCWFEPFFSSPPAVFWPARETEAAGHLLIAQSWILGTQHSQTSSPFCLVRPHRLCPHRRRCCALGPCWRSNQLQSAEGRAGGRWSREPLQIVRGTDGPATDQACGEARLLHCSKGSSAGVYVRSFTLEWMGGRGGFGYRCQQGAQRSYPPQLVFLFFCY